MTPTEIAAKLRVFNEWRRGDEDIPQFDPRDIGEAIDAAVEMIDRLEAAERERNVLKAKVEQMDAAFESLLIRCDDSDSEMYGTLSTSFVRDTVRIARGT